MQKKKKLQIVLYILKTTYAANNINNKLFIRIVLKRKELFSKPPLLMKKPFNRPLFLIAVCSQWPCFDTLVWVVLYLCNKS